MISEQEEIQRTINILAEIILEMFIKDVKSKRNNNINTPRPV